MPFFASGRELKFEQTKTFAGDSKAVLNWSYSGYYGEEWSRTDYIVGDTLKNDGPSNMIHWQRINSLTKEMPSKGSKREEQLKLIEDEKATYQAEYNAVQDVIKGVKSFTNINESF